MTTYIIRRLLWFIPVFLVITAITFFTVRAIPGGPFDFAGEKPLPEPVVKNLEQKYGLDKPVYVQYINYLRDLLRLDLGYSYKYRGRPVREIMGESFRVSFQLGLYAFFLGLLIGIPMGVVAALTRNSIFDYGSTFIAIFGVSIPNLVLGPLLIWLFALKLGWLPTSRWVPLEKSVTLHLKHAILPAVTLGTALSASIARLTRASLLQVIREDYIRTAYAKGLPGRLVITRHALRNSFIPVATILGPMFANVITGSLIIEVIFGIPGMGRHFVQSIGNRDYPIVMATTIIYAVLIITANLVVDIAYGYLDPRIRYD